MKIFLSILFVFFHAFSKGQPIIDSLSVGPNPFVKRTSIYFSFINNDTVSVKVYSGLGQILTSVMNLYSDSIMLSGVYQDSLKMDSYPDGIYYLHLILGNRKTIIKKILKANTAGIHENIKPFENFKTYPNPTKGSLFIESDSFNKMIITNSLGQGVFEIKQLDSKHEIDLRFLPIGVYFLTVSNEESQKVFKILKE